MRSNTVKQCQSKSKKILQYVHLMSCYNQQKSKKIDKKTQSGKFNSNKNYPNKQFCSNKDQIHKQKYTINLDHQTKKHNRSKTQWLKPQTNPTFPDQPFQEQIFVPKYNTKKTLKKQNSKKRLQTQSCKRLYSTSQSKSNNNQDKFKPSLNINKQVIKTNKSQSKGFHKKQQRFEQQKQKQISKVNESLQILRQKLKRQRSEYSSKDKKGKQYNKNQDSKNLTFLNLSQILQRNDLDQELFFDQQRNEQKRNIKSQRSKIQKKQSINKRKLKQIYSNLDIKINYLTQTIKDKIKSRYNTNLEGYRDQYNINGRSFSFVDQLNFPVKHGKSNFSTGVQSTGAENQIKQLLRLKLHVQSSISKQIQIELNNIRQIHGMNKQDDQPKTARVNEQNQMKRQIISARQLTGTNKMKNKLLNQQIDQKERLIGFVCQFNQLTQSMLPLISQLELNKEDQRKKQNPQIQIKQIKQQNEKLTNKFTDIMQKNNKYQHILNLLIQDGVNVQKYINAYFNHKK